MCTDMCTDMAHMYFGGTMLRIARTYFYTRVCLYVCIHAYLYLYTHAHVHVCTQGEGAFQALGAEVKGLNAAAAVAFALTLALRRGRT